MLLQLSLVALLGAFSRAQPDCQAAVWVNTTQLARAGEWVSVSWALGCAGDATDFLALLPAGADILVCARERVRLEAPH